MILSPSPTLRPARRASPRAFPVILAALLAGAGPAQADDAAVVALKVKRIYPVSAAPIDGGILLIRDGKLSALGPDVTIPEGAKVLDLPAGVVTPGLIDAHALLDPETPQSSMDRRVGFWEELGRHAAMQRATALPRAGYAIDAERDMPPAFRGAHAGDHAGHAEADGAGHDHTDGARCPLCGTRALPPFAVSAATGRVFSEQSAEIIPHRLMIDTYNPLSNDFDRLLRSGVTTVYMSSDSSCVIGMRGAIVKTGGPAAGRVVRRADAIKAALGSDPSNRGSYNDLPNTWSVTFNTRRPTTRMGVEWVFRKALYDARRAADGLPLSGADSPPAEAIPALNELLAGKIGLRIQARKQHDIFTALRLADEFGLRFVLEEATEAYRCLPQLTAAKTPVIYGPMFVDPRGYRAASLEADNARLITPRALHDAGIRFALTANDLRDEAGLVRQAMTATRYGLPADAALRAITAAPAEIMGLADGFGTLSSGAAADLVVWSAEPFDPTSRALLVMIDGQVVYED